MLRDARRRIEQRLEDEIHQLKLQMIEEAAASHRLGELAFARGEYESAADLFAEAADSVPTSEPEARVTYKLRQADALYRKGEAFEDQVALAQAAEHYRAVIPVAERLDDGDLVIASRGALADALYRIGSAETGSAHLREAVGIWKDTLPWFDRNTQSERFSATCTAMGDALVRVAERDNDDACFELAYEAYDQALSVVDRTNSAVPWAMAQLGRGSCLLRAAERENKDSLWHEAAGALFAALDVLEANGATELAGRARNALKHFHTAWEKLLRSEQSGGENPVAPANRIARTA
jgi:tetratricopeptide (TPR) repeat protein